MTQPPSVPSMRSDTNSSSVAPLFPPRRESPAASTHLRPARNDVDYHAHPFLDPELFKRDRYALRYFIRLFRDYMRNDWQYARLLDRLLHSRMDENSLEVNERILASYFEDADLYVRELMQFVPEEMADVFAPDPEVEACEDLRCLGRLVFEHHRNDAERARRIRFEAQRKLYLTKLLIQVEHTRVVQDGPRHRDYLNDLLDRELWAYVTETRDETAGYRPGERESDGGSRESDQEDWRFRVRRVVRNLPGGHYDIAIDHFDTRFKKEIAGYEYSPGQTQYQVAEQTRYGRMKRNRSASILSKMLRKGINAPNAITDILGAKFIVGQERDVHRLADLLHQVLGGLFLFRNQVDLFRRPEDHQRLNAFSSREFRAFKEDVDILYGGGNGGQSYLFSVELQIFTRESFLQTVHSRAYASHRAYKRRQFLQGVMPYVFPATIYGRPISEMVPLPGE